MKKRTIVHPDNLPMRVPTQLLWLLLLSMSVWDAPAWVWGAAWTLYAIVAAVAVTDLFTREAKRVFPESDD